jgi:peptidoglycan hydrolase-like protein with peptidoglycan-binding domain
LVAAGWWAGLATVGSSVREGELQAPLVATVTETVVGRSLSLTATVRRPYEPVAVNGLAGTVTSVNTTDRVKVGDVLYSVDTVPVAAVVGSLPFYRDLTAGDTGRDVSQLQRALRSIGRYSGPVSGRFDAATTRAVKAWQRSLRTPPTGTMALGAIVAVPSLPAPLRLGEQIVRGFRVAGGEQAVLAPTGQVEFYLAVSEAQAALITTDAAVVVTHTNQTWPAVIVDATTGTDGTVRLDLAAPDGGRVCAKSCEALPAGDQVSLRAKVTVVPEVRGPAVPVAAIRTNPDGTAYVFLPDGSRRAVTVLGSSGGIAVVNGVAVGERVIVRGSAASDEVR